MIVAWIFKGVQLIFIIFLAWLVAGLYKVFSKMPDNRFSNDKGYVAFGMMAEVILMLILAVRVITG